MSRAAARRALRPAAVLVLLAIGIAPLRAQHGGATHAHHQHAGAGTGTPAQGTPAGGQADDFLRAAIQGSARFHDRREAISAGYRRIGPDFPGMGEHWIHLGVLIGGRLDPASPTFLSYAEIGGAPVLVGVAYAVPLGADEPAPEWPAGRDAWHDHTRSIDAEVLLTQSGVHAHAERPRARLAMLHAWVWLENAEGAYAKENWALPFLRAGLPPPEGSHPSAARALSLVTNRAFYDGLLGTFNDLGETERSRLRGLIDTHSRRVDGLVDDMRAGVPGAAEMARLASVWRELWEAAAAGGTPPVRAAVEVLRGDSR